MAWGTPKRPGIVTLSSSSNTNNLAHVLVFEKYAVVQIDLYGVFVKTCGKIDLFVIRWHFVVDVAN
jgi:hypothetical protein